MARAQEKINGPFEGNPYQLDQIQAQTQDDLESLKASIDTEGQTAELMSSLVNEAIVGLEKDLEELGIRGIDQNKYIDEYKALTQKETSEIIKDGVLDSKEHEALSNFISDPNNFPALKAKIEREKKGGGTGAISLEAKINSFLKDISGWGIVPGSEGIQKMIAGAIAFAAKTFGVDAMLLGAMEKINPTPEKLNLEGRNLYELCHIADSKAVNKYLKTKIPGFEKLTENELIIKNGSEKDHYRFDQNALGQDLFQKNGGEKVPFDGSIENFNEIIQKNKNS